MATAQMTDKSEQKKSDQKQKALDTALTQIERSYGKGAIMRMGDEGFSSGIEAIPTGALNLDAAIGIGGIPRGRGAARARPCPLPGVHSVRLSPRG